MLEDDLETSPDFLCYMNGALDKYRDEAKVMQISGHMFDVKIKAENDAIFLSFVTSWGWATWKRAWDCFDPSMADYAQIKNNSKLMHKFNLEGAYDYFKMLQSQLHGRIDSWAIRWYLSVFMQNGLILYPSKSFVRNIGFDGSGTHCGVSVFEKEGSLILSSERNVFNFPMVNIDNKAYADIRLFLSGGRGAGSKRKLTFGCGNFISKLTNFFRL